MRTTTPLAGPNYDDLKLHRSGRILSHGDSEVATHLIFEVSAYTSEGAGPVELFKVIRLGVVGEALFEEGCDPLVGQRDLLMALRHRSLDFICVVGNIAGEAMLAFGVQGVSADFGKAVNSADDAWDKLASQMLATSNRFISPLSTRQADALVGAATTWDQIAMMKDQPGEATSDYASPFERFLGSGDGEFLITLLASPITSGELILAHHTAKLDAELGVDSELFQRQLRRRYEGLEYGAFLYQGFVLAPSEEDLDGVSMCLESAFWDSDRGAHTTPVVDSVEARRLRIHAATFSSDLCPGDDVEGVMPYEYSSYVTLSELARFAHPVS